MNQTLWASRTRSSLRHQHRISGSLRVPLSSTKKPSLKNQISSVLAFFFPRFHAQLRPGLELLLQTERGNLRFSVASCHFDPVFGWRQYKVVLDDPRAKEEKSFLQNRCFSWWARRLYLREREKICKGGQKFRGLDGKSKRGF